MKLPAAMFAAALILAACSQETAAPAGKGAAAPALLEDLAGEDISAAAAVEAVPAEPEPLAPVNPEFSFDNPPPQAEAQTEPPAPAPAPPQPAATQRDARLVGIWVNEDIINSGGADFASFTTIMTMEIHADGRILQYTESVGGGGDWSYGGNRTLDFEGQWRGDGRTLTVYGMGLPDFTPVATYEFSGGYMVTHSDMGRLIWQKRG